MHATYSVALGFPQLGGWTKSDGQYTQGMWSRVGLSVPDMASDYARPLAPPLDPPEYQPPCLFPLHSGTGEAVWMEEGSGGVSSERGGKCADFVLPLALALCWAGSIRSGLWDDGGVPSRCVATMGGATTAMSTAHPPSPWPGAPVDNEQWEECGLGRASLGDGAGDMVSWGDLPREADVAQGSGMETDTVLADGVTDRTACPCDASPLLPPSTSHPCHPSMGVR